MKGQKKKKKKKTSRYIRKVFVLRAAPLFLVYFTRENPGIVNVQFFIFLVDIVIKKKINKILAAFEINVWS